MDKYKYENLKILRTAMSKFMSLELEDGDLRALFFEADNLRDVVEHHGEKI